MKLMDEPDLHNYDRTVLRAATAISQALTKMIMDLPQGAAEILGVGIIILMPSLAMAQPLDRDKAQTDMLLRVDKSVKDFAAKIGLPKLYSTYCATKLNLSRKNMPVDGSVPYGVNYNTASDETLRVTLSIREEYETGYMMVCLAEAKNAISVATQ
jgi:hypothetical protein